MHPPTSPSYLVHTGLAWHNHFQQLGRSFYTPLAPQPLREPYWVGKSDSVADMLGLGRDQLRHEDMLQALAGNRPISGTQPLASVYSGHQFGQWAGQLGDGRAILLGEVNGLEVQLKGSGLTPYSRMGDGRAVLRSSIREFLCSEAMHALGIPTTRALCVVGSDDTVWREAPETTAVVTRVAQSFVRFGHFEHFAARNQLADLKTLADYVIGRYYPDCLDCQMLDRHMYANFLQRVVERTAIMVAHWQSAGFCHGVMNTDNMSILGLTMDYGPFQFLDVYDPGHICNHTDRQGRYAFDKQPDIAHWNLYALAQALLPLIGNQSLALQALDTFKPLFSAKFRQLMSHKLGLTEAPAALIDALLTLLANNRVDYTIFWHRLSAAHDNKDSAPVRDLFLDRDGFDAWMLRYSEHCTLITKGVDVNLMHKANPKYVLRNYLGEEAIAAARNKDFTGVSKLLMLLCKPFDEHPGFGAYADFPPDWAKQIEISCSS